MFILSAMTPMEITLVVLSLTVYGSVASADVKSLARWLWGQYFNKPGNQPPDSAKVRVASAMRQLTEENFANASALLQHAMLLAVILFASVGAPFFAFLCFLKAIIFMVIAKGYVKMTATMAKAYIILSYVLFVPFMWAPARKEVTMAYRMMMVIQCVDSKMHIPCQFCLSLAEASFHLLTVGMDETATSCFIIQIFAAATASTVSVVLENCFRHQLEAQFRSTDAETITSGFRQVLRGICDGEVLLNDDLRIEGKFQCLNHLMSTQDDLTNKRFQDLLVSDHEEQARFTEFISSSVARSDDTPPCLRVSLNSCSTQRVGVDVYHVALPHFRGSSEVYHLLALKEDADVQTKPPPDAMVESFPDQLLPTASGSSALLRLRRQVPPGARSVASDGSVGCLFTTVPHLAEMILLLDPTSLEHDIKQVHLNYKDISQDEGGDGPSPSLKGLIRPMDWEKIHAKVTRYIDSARRQLPEPKTLRSMWIRRLDKPSKYMKAKKVNLYFADKGRAKKDDNSPAQRRLWLSLAGCSA